MPFLAGDLGHLAEHDGLTQLGNLGYAQVTANQTGIGVIADLTGLSVAVTVGSGRRIRITVDIQTAVTVAGAAVELSIREGSTYLNSRHKFPPAGGAEVHQVMAILTPSAGAHTYKASLALSFGSGTVGAYASAQASGYILVEDIGT